MAVRGPARIAGVWDLRGPSSRVGSFTRRIGTHQHFVWLYWIVGATLLLNLADAVLTLLWVHSGMATEANPLLAELVTNHPVAFVATKYILVTLGSVLLWRHRKRRLAVIAIFLCFLVYYWLLLYHIRGVDWALFRERLFGD